MAQAPHSELYIQHRGQPQETAIQVMSADGAISLEDGIVFITKGSAIAASLAGPSQDGLRLEIVSTTANAHVVTHTSSTINGAYGTMTWAAVAGFSAVLRSYNGTWFGHTGTGVTFA